MLSLEDIGKRLPAGEPWEPLARAMFFNNTWLLKPMLDALTEDSLADYFIKVAEIWSVLHGIRPIDPAARVAEVIKGLQFHSIEFLKLQIEFTKTGQYKSSDFEKVQQQVYDAAPVMQRYLDGLLLTYVAWPNHYSLLHYYRTNYLGQGVRGRCLEIGPGHGWLAREQLRSSPDNTLLAIDVSSHSAQYTQDVLRVGEIAPSRYDIRVCNADLALRDDLGTFDRIVIAEVIEHLERPAEILKLLVSKATAETRFFITTVVNIEAPDHIYLFRTLDEVRDLLSQCGLKILDELDLPLNLNLKMEKPAYEVAMICSTSKNV